MGMGIREWARRLIEAGYSPVPIRAHEKVPAVAQWQRGGIDDSAFRPAMNIGVRIIPDLVIFDLDLSERSDRISFVDELEVWFGLRRPQLFSTLTPSGGVHLWFSCRGIREGKENFPWKQGRVDVLHGGRYQVLIPPSVLERGPYRWGPSCDEERFLRRDFPAIDPGRLEQFIAVLSGGPKPIPARQTAKELPSAAEIRDPTAQEIEQTLGLRPWRRGHGWTLYHCPIHPPDEHGSLSIWASGAIRDYHDGQGYNWVSLAYRVLGTNDYRRVCARFGIELPSRTPASETKPQRQPRRQSGSTDAPSEESSSHEQNGEVPIKIIRLRKYDMEPQRYDIWLEVGSCQYELTTLSLDQILSWSAMRKIMFGKHNRLLQTKNPDWPRSISEIEDRIETQIVDKEESTRDAMVNSTIERLAESAISENESASIHLAMGFVRRSDGTVVFRTKVLLESLAKAGTRISRPDLLAILRRMNMEARTVRLRDGKLVWVWVMERIAPSFSGVKDDQRQTSARPSGPSGDRKDTDDPAGD